MTTTAHKNKDQCAKQKRKSIGGYLEYCGFHSGKWLKCNQNSKTNISDDINRMDKNRATVGKDLICVQKIN